MNVKADREEPTFSITIRAASRTEMEELMKDLEFLWKDRDPISDITHELRSEVGGILSALPPRV